MMARTPLLWLLLGVQLFSALYFSADALIDILGLDAKPPPGLKTNGLNMR